MDKRRTLTTYRAEAITVSRTYHITAEHERDNSDVVRFHLPNGMIEDFDLETAREIGNALLMMVDAVLASAKEN